MQPSDLEMVVLVDDRDHEVGVAEKHAAHRDPGVLHRAVSAWLTDPDGRVLLQRRASGKYHFPARWSNACCTHPRPGEHPRDAIQRRVREELGVEVTLARAGRLLYRAQDPTSGLVEHELDHVFTGVLTAACTPDPREVDDVALLEPEDLVARLAADRDGTRFTPWLPLIAARVLNRSWPDQLELAS